MTEHAATALARLASHWASADLPTDVSEAARHALLDWFATTLPGTVRAPATLLAATGLGGGQGRAICYVDGKGYGPRDAAFINATASHTVEFDDIFRDGGYHPGSPTIAAALAMAQHIGASREALDRSIIGGYEAGCRLSLAIQPSHYEFWHTTSTVGTIGATVAAAMLLDCDVGQIANAISIASSFAGGHQQNLLGESTAKAMHPGHAAAAGILAAYAAKAGGQGAPDALEGEKGYCAATSASTGNWQAAFEGAGEWTPITRMTVKIHGCCGHIFPALDALEILRKDVGFAANDIDAISVEGYGATKTMCDRPDPGSAQEARFSLQYCLAAQMVLGAVRLNAFEPAALADVRIKELMRVISVEAADDLVAEYPRRRMARLTLRLKDGREFHHFQPDRKGDPENPVSRDELVGKYQELAGSVLSTEEMRSLQSLILQGQELPGVVRHPLNNNQDEENDARSNGWRANGDITA